jgi:hypothetical protein
MYQGNTTEATGSKTTPQVDLKNETMNTNMCSVSQKEKGYPLQKNVALKDDETFQYTGNTKNSNAFSYKKGKVRVVNRVKPDKKFNLFINLGSKKKSVISKSKYGLANSSSTNVTDSKKSIRIKAKLSQLKDDNKSVKYPIVTLRNKDQQTNSIKTREKIYLENQQEPNVTSYQQTSNHCLLTKEKNDINTPCSTQLTSTTIDTVEQSATRSNGEREKSVDLMKNVCDVNEGKIAPDNIDFSYTKNDIESKLFQREPPKNVKKKYNTDPGVLNSTRDTFAFDLMNPTIQRFH